MVQKFYQSNAYELCKYYQTKNKSICLIVKDNKEAKYLSKELSLFLNKDEINYFSEN